MNLGLLKPPDGSRKKRKRIGRGNGSGQGSTAGKGAKGQNARSGGGTRRGFEGGQMPLSRRLPKAGFRNPFRKQIEIVNVGQLIKFPEGSVIDGEALVRSGLAAGKGDGIKILAKGDINYPLSVKIGLISKNARLKIEAAGGSITEVD
jgi:large subunit ribosomal protein L15